MQEHSDDDDDTMDAPPPSKAIKKTESFSPGHKGDAEPRIANGEKSRSAVRSGEYSKVAPLAVESSTPSVRKSSRVPKKRVLDGDEDDAEPPNVLQRPSGHKRGQILICVFFHSVGFIASSYVRLFYVVRVDASIFAYLSFKMMFYPLGRFLLLEFVCLCWLLLRGIT